MDFLSRIPARSQRQAMDWGLVLISQGIEATIDCSQESGEWSLLVAPPEYQPALDAIRLYQLENRGWRWRQHFRPGLLFDWGSLAWVFLLALFYALDAGRDLRPAGFMDSVAVAHGQWWRWFTAVWLHADLGHLAANATLGCLLLGFTMGRYGTGIGLLAAYLAGAAGNVAAGLLSAGPHHSLGASGMVMGSLGLLAVSSLSWYRVNPRAGKLILTATVAGVMLFVLFGLTPGTDVMAHLGGFMAGLALGGLLSLIPAIARNSASNIISGLVFAVLVVLPWWLALRHAR